MTCQGSRLTTASAPARLWTLAAVWLLALVPADPAAAGLLRWWQMNELSGTTMGDSVGLQSGTYLNSPTLNGAYATFNGTDQWGRIATNGNSNIFDPAYETARSLSMWVKLDSTTRLQSLFGATTPSGGAGWSFYYMNTGALRFGRPGSANYDSVTSGIQPGVWTQVGYTLASNGTLTFYVNGQQLGNTVAASVAYNNNGGTSEPTVGLGSAGGGAYFVGGSMADVRYVVSGFGGAFNSSNGMTGFTDGAITAANMQTLYGIKPIDPANVTATASGSTITAGGTLSIANAVASGGRIRDDAMITVLPTLSGSNASRFSWSGITANQTIAPGASATATVSFTDPANLLNGAVATASLSGLTVARATMPGLGINSATFTTAGTLSYTVASPTITGNTAPLGVAQTANAANLTGLSSETIRGVAGALGTRATLLSGTADNGTAVSQTWRLRTGIGVETANIVVSDVVDLTTPTTSNAFVLQLTYDPADLPSGTTEDSLLLGWADPSQGGAFVNAVLGNSDAGAFSQFVAGAWDSSYTTPGYYGLDAQANTAWAVLDHNSDFAVVVVPEPDGLLCVAGGVAAMLLAQVKRRRDPRERLP